MHESWRCVSHLQHSCQRSTQCAGGIVSVAESRQVRSEAHPKKTQGEKDRPTAPNYSKLTESSNCSRFTPFLFSFLKLIFFLALPRSSPVHPCVFFVCASALRPAVVKHRQCKDSKPVLRVFTSL